ncbi:perlucin-like [Mercenaria mercenaria]|uniref:perlucin-like n=1 Tax=Mercenaria mercenaria TaxID=6596 RepID=UPI00234FB0D3|nr:perlucin-like [Mercenaria mercenaria]
MLVLISAILICAIESTIAACPHGFEINDGTCYFFSHGEETWFGAYESCKLFGSMLVEVNSADENIYLYNKTSTLGDSNSWWMGLTDKLVEGEYVWETSKHVLVVDEYTDWAVGEPNNHHDENCVKFAHSKGFLWQDTECDDEEHYICEKLDDSGEIVG